MDFGKGQITSGESRWHRATVLGLSWLALKEGGSDPFPYATNCNKLASLRGRRPMATLLLIPVCCPLASIPPGDSHAPPFHTRSACIIIRLVIYHVQSTIFRATSAVERTPTPYVVPSGISRSVNDHMIQSDADDIDQTDERRPSVKGKDGEA
jgi:hypothetical protein